MKKKYTTLVVTMILGVTICKAQWTPVNTGLTNHSISHLAVSGSNLFAATGTGVYLSDNNGISWSSVNTGLTNGDVRGFAVSGSNLFAGTYGAGVFLTSNNGSSWTAMNSGLSNLTVWSMATSGTNIYAGTSAGVFFSNNNGNSWSAINSGLGSPIFSIYIDGSSIYAGSYDGMHLSTNNGITWTGLNTTQTDPVYSIDIAGSEIFAGTTPSGLFLSSNNGSSWSWSNNGLTNDTVTTFLNSGSAIFAATTGGGVCLTINNGVHWAGVNSGLTDLWVNSIVNKGTSIFAGTDGGGVFSRPLSEMINCVAYFTTTYDSTLNNFTLFVDSTTASLATSYHWNFGDGTTSNLAYPSHTYASDTVYNVCLKIYTASGDSCEYCHYIGKDYLGNIYRTVGFTLNVHNPNSTVGTENAKRETNITIAPNPFTSQTKVAFSSEQKNTTIKIIDVLGKELKTETFTGKQLIIEKGEMQAGIYFVQIMDENKNKINRKIVIQ